MEHEAANAMEKRLSAQIETLATALNAFTHRFDETENRVADIHMVHTRIKRAEAVYTRHYTSIYGRGDGQGLLAPETTQRLGDSDDTEEEEDSGEADNDEYDGNYGFVLHQPNQRNRLQPTGRVGTGVWSQCCAIQ